MKSIVNSHNHKITYPKTIFGVCKGFLLPTMNISSIKYLNQEIWFLIKVFTESATESWRIRKYHPNLSFAGVCQFDHTCDHSFST